LSREAAEFLEHVRLASPLEPEVFNAPGCILHYGTIGIVAAASIEGCRTHSMEDMHHGLIIDNTLTLRNPFP